MRPFERIVAEHGPAVLRVCRAMLGPADAEDAWAETFLAALKAYPDLDEHAHVEAWLITIAHRKAIDAARARARRPLTVEHVPEAHDPGPGWPGARDTDLWQAVAALPARQRAAVAYHYLAGLPYADIAVIIGGTTEAVRRAAADGIKNLRKSYAPAMGTEGGNQ
jgi:RNA polymerase sigma factor (sigma-70 family)